MIELVCDFDPIAQIFHMAVKVYRAILAFWRRLSSLCRACNLFSDAHQFNLRAIYRFKSFTISADNCYWIHMEFLHNLTDVTHPPMVSHRNRAPTFEILSLSNGDKMMLNDEMVRVITN